MTIRAVLVLLAVLTAGVCVQGAGKMTEQEILATADSRIEKVRKADLTVRVVYPNGKPVSGVKVKVEQTRHAFLFGCNAFPMLHLKGAKRDTYAREFTALLNYATLPFYWGAYEREPGKTNADAVMQVARWLRERGVTPKGHPLVWHEVYPGWAPSDPDGTREAEQARVTETVSRFKGVIDYWDVVNEATVSAKFDNGVGHWAKRDGAAAMVGQALDWARAANRKATLLYNDFNLGQDFEKLVSDLLAARKPVDAIGIQSHMHGGEWPIEKAWQTCETYAKFGKPLHFTELTVLSGKHGWNLPKPWPTTPEGEAKQADYVEKFYTVLFSHPAVQAITWWDFADENGSWMGAPAGLVRSDLTPKPVYDRLKSLIKGKWWTKTEGTSDAKGELAVRGFLGSYKVTVITPKGYKIGHFELGPGPKVWTIKLVGSKPSTER